MAVKDINKHKKEIEQYKKYIEALEKNKYDRNTLDEILLAHYHKEYPRNVSNAKKQEILKDFINKDIANEKLKIKTIQNNYRDNYVETHYNDRDKKTKLVNYTTDQLPNEKNKAKLIKRTDYDKIGPILGRHRYFFEGVNSNRELFEAIKDLADFNRTIYDRPPSHITMLFKEVDGNKITARNLSSIDLDDENAYNDFNSLVAKLMVESKSGSDPIGLLDNDYELILDSFTLSYYAHIGNGSSDNIIFECENIESKKGFCGYECLKKCGFDYKGEPKDLMNLEKLIDVIKENNLSIVVIANTINNYHKKGMKTQRMHLIVDGKEDEFVIYKPDDIKPVYIYDRTHLRDNNIIYEDEDGETQIEKSEEQIKADTENHDAYLCESSYIIYDPIGKHFDVAKYPLKLKDDVLVNINDVILKKADKDENKCNYNIAAKMKRTNDAIKKVRLNNDSIKVEYIFFDYETVINMDKENCMQEYSLSINVCDINAMKDFSDADKNKDDKKLKELREKHCITFLGFDCSKQFIEWIIKNQQDKVFIFIGYNNANFDNLIFLCALLEYRKIDKDAITISNEQYNNNQLLNFIINGRHRLFDIRKHLTMGNLAGLCKSFGLNLAAKKKFDHSSAQRMYNESPETLLKFIENNEPLKEYNEFDVISIATIYFRYRRALKDIAICRKYAFLLYETPTVGSLVWKIFKDNQEKEQIELPKLKYEHYKEMLKYKVAGRVEMFNGIKELYERICSMDVCSLYPYIMMVAPNYFPTGSKYFEVENYMGDDILGFYYVDIDQNELKEKNLPNIYAEKIMESRKRKNKKGEQYEEDEVMENEWSSQNELKRYFISNVMIRLLKKFDCKVKIYNGIVFENHEKGFKIFKFLAEFMKCKNQQDEYKKNKDPNYNGVLREVYKLLMNSMSGKVIQKLFTDKIKAIDTTEEFIKLKEKAESINFINAVGGRLYCSYTMSEEDLISQQSPVFLGIFIYDYAKEFMYTHAYSKIGLKNLIYTDTDSCKFPHQHLAEWEKYAANTIVPHWGEIEEYDPRYKEHKLFNPDSKVFGSFEDEYADKVAKNPSSYYFICLEKKTYLYKTDNAMTYKFKGINPNSIPLKGNEDIIEYVKDEAKLIDNYKKVYEFYENNKNFEGDIKQFYKFFDVENVGPITDFYYDNKDKTIITVEKKLNDLIKKLNLKVDADEILNFYESEKEKTNLRFLNFYKEFAVNHGGLILTSSFKKIVKNTLRDVIVNDDERANKLMNHVQVCFSIKNLDLTRKDDNKLKKEKRKFIKDMEVITQ